MVLSLVDSYRRRAKPHKPFPVTAPAEVVDRRRHHHDLHLRRRPVRRHARRHRPRRAPDPVRDLHLEGRRGRAAVQEGAQRGRGPRGGGLRGLRRVREPRRPPRFKRFGPRLKVLEYPVYSAGWAFFDLRRYGRDHRKILRGRRRGRHSSAATTSGRRTPPSGATRTSGSPARASGTSSAPSPTSSTGTARPGTASGRCCWRRSRTGSRGSGCTATCRGSGCSRSARCTSRRSTGPRTTSG